MRTMPRKRYGQIYVEHAEDCAKVRDIIRQMDDFEFSYLPDDMVAPISEYPQVVYTHKFDALDLDALTIICWRRGIKIFALSETGGYDYIEDAYEKFECRFHGRWPKDEGPLRPTRDEFAANYQKWLKDRGKPKAGFLKAVPCSCTYPECRGWRMVPKDPEMRTVPA